MAAETQPLQTETAHESGVVGVLGTLGINGQLLIAQLINFAIILIVLWRWVYKPLLAKMDERSKKISDGLVFAKESKKALNDAEVERDQILREAKAEAHKLTEKATADAEKLRGEKMVQAKTEIEKVIVEAKQQIKMEREASFAALKGEIAELVTMATAKVASSMDEKAQRGMIASALKDIENA
ncbi:MAG: F0F1 ATP synthase subunit B [Patescibacteria group bacterium]